ncbi:hypothetical protein B0J17DRAFT_712159 [Rhizoctonia solani]|nr:hypothetical protein B0J17DRAFT_712159 [Rhizoctonia solani]
MDTLGNTSTSAKEGAPVAVTSDAVNNRNSLNAATHLRTKSLKTKASVLTLHETANVHDLNGINVRFQINNEIIKTHESRINNDTLTITIDGGDELVNDFLKTFKLLDASSIDRPKYEPTVLVSAARIAAPNAYKFDALYQYCIKKLEGLSLNSMERIYWEKNALTELSGPKEVITKDEAKILGMNAYWEVATERERHKGRKLEDMLQQIKDKSEEVPPQSVFQSVFPAKQEYVGTLENVFEILSLGLWIIFILGIFAAPRSG